MRLKVSLLVMLLGLSVNGCDKEPYLDRNYSASPKAYTNVFELLKNYEKQTDAPGQSDGVRVIRYYEKNQGNVGYTNKASTWFSLITEDEIKERMVKRMKRFLGDDPTKLGRIVGPIRVNDGFGFYLDDSPCFYISLLKRVGPGTGYDNDYDDPDFIGHFRICRGLTVTPKEFIEKIGLADDAAEARYLAIVSKTAASASPTNK